MHTASQWDWSELRRIAEREARRIVVEDVDDVVQEALVRAWRAADACTSGNAPQAWMAQIARREALRARVNRRRHPTVGLDDAPVEPQAPSRDDAVATAVDVRRALAALAPGDRRLVRLRYEEDLTHPAIAELTGQSLSSVKVRLHRARRKLHVALADT